jgi:hypothetical protein
VNTHRTLTASLRCVGSTVVAQPVMVAFVMYRVNRDIDKGISMPELRDKAVVLGANPDVPLAARVLSDSYRTMTVDEYDLLCVGQRVAAECRRAEILTLFRPTGGDLRRARSGPLRPTGR